jgi:TetR/AcrR family transcriptional regulator, transcriptional repressor for nem operon
MNDTREKILQQSLGLFLKKTFKEVSMNDLVQASGMSKGGFYHYFDSKEALFKEIAETYVVGIFKINFNFLDNRKLPLNEYILSYLMHIVNMVKKLMVQTDVKFEEVNFYAFLFDIFKYCPGFRDKISLHHDDELNLLASIIESARKDGEIKESIDSAVLANHIHTLIHGIGILIFVDGNYLEKEKEVTKLINSFYELIKV